MDNKYLEAKLEDLLEKLGSEVDYLEKLDLCDIENDINNAVESIEDAVSDIDTTNSNLRDSIDELDKSVMSLNKEIEELKEVITDLKGGNK